MGADESTRGIVETFSKAAYLRMMQVDTDKVALGSAGDCATRKAGPAQPEVYPTRHVTRLALRLP
jgi:hypothetical protein